MKCLWNKQILLIGLFIALLGVFLYAIEGILLPFVLAFVLAYVLHPSVVKLEKCHLNRTAATSIIVVGFCLFIVMISLILIPILQTQVFEFFAKIPDATAAIWGKLKSLILLTRDNMSQEQLARISDAVGQAAFTFLNSVGTTLSRVISGGFAIFNVVSLIVVSPVVLFYVLRDWKHVQETIASLIPKHKEKEVKTIWQEINQTLAGFIRGQAAVCFFLGLFYALGLSLVGLDLGILVGLLAGILSFIPYFGFSIGVLLSVLLALTQGASMGMWIGLGVVFIIGQILESYVLTPYLVGKNVGLSAVWVIFALLVGGVLFGFLGILLAVPVAAVIGVLLRHALAWYRTTDFYKGNTKGK